MNESYVRNVIEAALLAAGKSLHVAELAQLFDESARPGVEDVRAGLESLAGEYAGRGIEIKETAAGFRIQVRRELAGEISRLWPERPAKYSRALLETLALIAYRQPITRAEIEAVRGVAVNPNILKTMIERNWVRVVGHRDVPGRPELLGTTREFLEYFGLQKLDDLPPLSELKSLGELNMQLALPEAPVSDTQTAQDADSSATDAVPDGAAGSPEHYFEAASEADGPATATATPASAQSMTDEESLQAGADAAVPEEDPFAQRVSETIATDNAECEEEMREDREDDELSADGSDSRELVAAPPRFED